MWITFMISKNEWFLIYIKERRHILNNILWKTFFKKSQQETDSERYFKHEANSEQSLRVHADSLISSWKHFCNFKPVNPMKNTQVYSEDVYMGDIMYSKTVCHYYGLCFAVKARPVHGWIWNQFMRRNVENSTWSHSLVRAAHLNTLFMMLDSRISTLTGTSPAVSDQIG